MQRTFVTTIVAGIALVSLAGAAGFAAGRAGAGPARLTDRSFAVHTVESAPAGSKATLERVSKSFGFVPGMLAVLGESPAALNAYMSLSGAIAEGTLTPIERNVAAISVAVFNECTFCVPAHATIGVNSLGMTQEQIDSLEGNSSLKDAKLEAIRVFAREITEARGAVSESQIESFLKAGYTRAQVLEVVAIVAQKTMSNYTNGVTHVPLDEQFASQKWTPKAKK